MMHFHSVIRPGAATLARTPELRALDTKSYGFAIGVHGVCVLIFVLAALVKPDLKPPPPIEVAIVVDGPSAVASTAEVEQPKATSPAVVAPEEMPAIGRARTLSPGQATPLPSDSKAAGKAGEARREEVAKTPEKPLEPWELSPKPKPVDPPKPPTPDPQTANTKTESAAASTPTAKSGDAQSESAAAGPTADHVAAPQSGGEGSILVAPLPYFKPRPPYPREAERQGLSGRVVLRMVIMANGRISGVAVVTSSGSPLLDEAARRGVMQWKFNPGRRASGPVDTTVDIPVDFTLDR